MSVQVASQGISYRIFYETKKPSFKKTKVGLIGVDRNKGGRLVVVTPDLHPQIPPLKGHSAYLKFDGRQRLPQLAKVRTRSMDRQFFVFVYLLIASIVFTDLAPSSFAEDRRIRVLATTFPIYQITKNVTSGSTNLDLSLMLPPNLGCPHDYSLKPQDLMRLSEANAIVINGLGLEEFLGDKIRELNPNIRTIDSSSGIADTMAYTDTHSDSEKNSNHGHEEHSGINPHLFASPRMVAKMAENISRSLSLLNPEEAALYQRNAGLYAEKMNRLADEFASIKNKLRSNKIVTQHGIFDYLARDAGLSVVALVQVQDGEEPSASEILGIIKKTKDGGAVAVFTEPQYSAQIGATIAEEAQIMLETLDPVATGPSDASLDYYELTMRKNLQTLVRALGPR